MAGNTVFRVSTDYDRQAAEARKRRRMADLLAQQVIEPTQYGPGPTPAAAPLVQGLQAFLAARAGRKADEAEEGVASAQARAGEQIAGRLTGGAPVREVAPPDASGLGEVKVESEYRASPEDAFRLALTPAGGAAMKGNPMLAAMLAQSMEKPKALQVGAIDPAKFTPQSLAAAMQSGDVSKLEPRNEGKSPTVAGGMMWSAEQNKFVPIEGYAEQQERIAKAKRPDVVVTGGGTNEPLVTVKGPDGNPIFVPRSQAVGKTPYTTRTAAQEIADVERAQAINQKSIDTQAALDNIEELLAHPGRISGTGASSFVSIVPGTAARGFQAQLETFKARTFIPMVSALKGMGALSDAEGKKLSAAVGALDPDMPEQEFERELRKIQKTLYEKASASGLNVVMPESLNGEAVDLPPPGAVRRKN